MMLRVNKIRSKLIRRVLSKILLKTRNKLMNLMKKLKRKNKGTQNYYPESKHLKKIYKNLLMKIMKIKIEFLNLKNKLQLILMRQLLLESYQKIKKLNAMRNRMLLVIKLLKTKIFNNNSMIKKLKSKIFNNNSMTKKLNAMRKKIPLNNKLQI